MLLECQKINININYEQKTYFKTFLMVINKFFLGNTLREASN